jgi:large subunit ribosomal protein L32e
MTEKKQSPSRKALQARARAKNKKPKFLRSESWRYSRFSPSWRKQRGLDNKIRRKIKGWPPAPSTGYKGPKIARGLHPSGYREVLVHNLQELSAVDPATQAVRIAHTVGKRKRALIIAEAKKLEIKILNIKVSPETEETEATEEEEAEAEGEEAEVEEAEEEQESEEAEAEEEKEAEEPKPKKEKKAKPKKSKPKPKKKEKKEQ